MSMRLHITSGDCCGASLAKAGLPGEVFVWHDVLYEGPRNEGWPTDTTLRVRALFLERLTGGGLKGERILETLRGQYARLEAAAAGPVTLWFDACLFDMAMLVHLLACLRLKGAKQVELNVIDAFPGVDPYDGLGQLTPEQLASKAGAARPVAAEQFALAARADKAFALQDRAELEALAGLEKAALAWLPAAAKRWLEEQPEPGSGLGRLERLALEAVRAGCSDPVQIMKQVSGGDSHPLFWGDTTLWAKINGLADRRPPLVKINGPGGRLPQWEGKAPLSRFTVSPLF